MKTFTYFISIFAVMVMFGTNDSNAEVGNQQIANPEKNQISDIQKHVQNQQLAQSCRPKDAVPNGSYKESCHSCEVQNCNWLVCTCDGKSASADLSKCPSDNYCNNHGRLQCGEC
jgi:hypothetical protein